MDRRDEVQGEWAKLRVSDRAGGVRVDVHVRPKSSRSSVLGVREGALDVALQAAPADGAANAELLKLLSRALEVRRGDVTIVAGMSSRTKLVDVNGVSPDEARERLAKAKR